MPLKAAVIECAPAVSPAVANVAVPFARVAVPSCVLPSLNAIVPDAMLGDTMAVKTTFCPKLDGLSEDVRDVVVELRTTF